MGYKILGFVVWHGAKLFVRKRYGHVLPSRRVATAGIVGVAVVGLALTAGRREQTS